MIDTPASGFEDFDIRPGLHGRRKGKKLRAHQSDLCETLLPRIKLDMSQPIDPTTLFPQPMADFRASMGWAKVSSTAEGSKPECTMQLAHFGFPDSVPYSSHPVL